MLVVQQADFEKVKSEYDVTILILAGKCIGHCHYLHDFILCIPALYMVLLPKSPPFVLILKVSQQVKLC